MKRKYLGTVLAAILLFGCAPVASADDYPHEIWPLMERYEAAMASGDDQELFDAGMQMVEMMEAQPDSPVRTEFLAGKYEQLMRAAERLDRYDDAVALIDRYMPYGRAMGWTDGLIYAERKRRILEPAFEVYTETPGASRVYYGAKYEPKNGSYFGSVYDNDPRLGDYDVDKVQQYFPKKNSVYLVYLEFGESLSQPRYPMYFRQATEAGAALMFAWNTYDDMSDIRSHEAYIDETLDTLEATGLPIFLRFANEMNIGSNGTNPESYVEAFRYVAEKAHQRSNLAVVWAPNDVGALDRPFASYYPGDAYVDWIGVSCYVSKYFNGLKDNGDNTEALNTYFYTDAFANPVARLREVTDFMRENGIEKPLMIAEGGVPHYIRTMGEDSTDWALGLLRRYYGELVRAYPQLKSICYFNVQMEEEPNDYALYSSDRLEAVYNEVVDDPYYISDFGTDAGFAYEPFGLQIVSQPQNLSAVAYYAKSFAPWVRYELDGAELFSTNVSPYRFTFDPAGYPVGAHTLTVRMFTEDGKEVRVKSYGIDIERSASVLLNGEEIAFADQRPVVIDGRTLVPLRGVFEQMGCAVDWIGESRTAVISTEGHDIRVPLDSDAISHNGATVKIDVPAQLVNGRTMVPIRAVTQLMNGQIDWLDGTVDIRIG